MCIVALQQQQQQQQPQGGGRHDSLNLAQKCLRVGYTPAHVLVNQERAVRGQVQLLRSPTLDRLAQFLAKQACKTADLDGIILHQADLQATLGKRHVAQIVKVGASVHAMHQQCMQEDMQAKRALISPRHKEFGMGTARFPDSDLVVMVQLLRG